MNAKTSNHSTKMTTHTKETTVNPKSKAKSHTTTHSSETASTTNATPVTQESTMNTSGTLPTASAPVAATPPANPTSPPTPAPAPAPPLVYVKAPPAIPLPAVPVLVTVAPPRDTRIQLPKKEELALMPDAVDELRRFTDFAAVFGKTAPSQNAVVQTVDGAYRWSELRIGLVQWTKYAKSQEVAAWLAARSVFGRLSPAFELTTKTDPEIGVQNPSLGELLKVRSAIAGRAVATKRSNKEKVANGEQPYAGGVGKLRKKRDEKAAFDAQQAHASQPVPTTPAPTTVPTAPPAAPAAPPVAPPAPPAATPSLSHS